MNRMTTARPDRGLLHIRVQPRAARAGIAGWRPDGALGVRSSAVEIVRGATGRDKYVRVVGLAIDDVIRRLGG